MTDSHIAPIVARTTSLLYLPAEPSRTGILQGDLLTAVDEVVVENKGLNHDFALREFLMDTALPAEQARASRSGMALN